MLSLSSIYGSSNFLQRLPTEQHGKMTRRHVSIDITDHRRVKAAVFALTVKVVR